MELNMIKRILFLVIALIIMAVPVCAENTYESVDELILNSANADDMPFYFANKVKANVNLSKTVFFGGNDLIIDGNYDGDVFIMGNNVEFSGTANGNIYSFGSDLNITGTALKDVFAFCANFTLKENADLKRDLYLFSENAHLNGNIGRDFTAFVADLNINSKIGGKALLSVDKLKISDTAKILGNLTYRSENDGQIAENTVGGVVDRKYITKEPQQFNIMKHILNVFRGTISVCLIWLLIIWLAPKFNEKSGEIAKNKFPYAFAYGFAVAILLPLASVFAMIFSVRLGFVLMFGYIIILMISIPVAIIAIANMLNKMSKFKKSGLPLYIFLLAIVYFALVQVSFLAFYVSLLMGVFGIGVLTMTLIREKKIPVSAPVEHTELPS